MIIHPKNKWIQVEFSFDKKGEVPETTLVALPDDYKAVEQPYKAVSVVRDPEGEYNYDTGGLVEEEHRVIWRRNWQS